MTIEVVLLIHAAEFECEVEPLTATVNENDVTRCKVSESRMA